MPNCLYNIYEWQLPGFLWRIIYWSNCLGLLCAFKTERNRFNCCNWFLLVWFFSDIWPFPEEALWVEGWEGEKHRQFYVEWKVDTCRVNWKKERCLDFSNWPYLFSANDQLKAVFAEAKEGNVRLIVVDIQEGMLLRRGGGSTDVPSLNFKSSRFAYWRGGHLAVGVILVFAIFAVAVVVSTHLHVISFVLCRCFEAMSLAGILP